MPWGGWLIAWVVLSIPAVLLLGRVIRKADEDEKRHFEDPDN